MTIRKNVDMGASFERLKNGLEFIGNKPLDDPQKVAYQLGYLKSAIRLHLRECTLEEGEKDDIPTSLFTKPGTN